MKQVTVTIAGEERIVHELQSRPNRRWREKAQPVIDQVLDAVSVFNSEDVSTARDLMRNMDKFKSLLLDNIDVVGDLVIEYIVAGDDTVDGEWLLDNAYDSELMEAAIDIVGMAFPVGFLTGAAMRIGSPSRRIGTNSPSPNTENGQTNSIESN